MMNKNREAFEAEFRRANPHEKHIDMMLEIYDHGTPDCPNIGYYSILARSAWAWWQASRQSIEVELPKKKSRYNMNSNGRPLLEPAEYDNAIEDCAEAITSLGIRVKGNEE